MSEGLSVPGAPGIGGGGLHVPISVINAALAFTAPSPPTATFTYDADAANVHSAFAAKGVTLSDGAKKAIHDFFVRIRTKGVLAAMRATSAFTPSLFIMRPLSATSGEEKINWLSPGTGDLTKFGSPTVTVGGGVAFPTSADYYETSIALNTIVASNFQMSCTPSGANSSTVGDIGAYDGTNGYSLAVASSGLLGRFGGALGGAIGTTQFSQDYTALASSSGTALAARALGLRKFSPSNTTATITSTLKLRVGQVNGIATPTLRTLRHAGFHAYLTDAQDRELAAALNDLINSFAATTGFLPFINEPGYLPATASADVGVVGWTSGGAAAVLQALKHGRSVAWIGGALDHRGSIGGTSTAGLGAIDDKQKGEATGAGFIGGLPRAILSKVNSIAGATDAIQNFEPRFFYYAMKNLLANLPGGTLQMFSTYGYGLAGVTKNAAGAIQSVTTGDGRVVSAAQWIDATEEIDLAYLAGCQTAIGRPAAGGGALETLLEGNLNVLTTSGAGHHQFGYSNQTNGSDALQVLPYASGTSGAYLPGVVDDVEIVGQADSLTMAYNYRIGLYSALNQYRSAPLPTSYPSGFSSADYELFFRNNAAATAASVTMTAPALFNLNAAVAGSTSYIDGNSGGGQSSDLIGGSIDYVAAGQNVAARLASSNKHWAYIKGWLYAGSAAAADTVGVGAGGSRTQTATLNLFNAYVLDALQFLVPSPDQEVGQPPRLYVREHRRLVGDFILTADDLAGTDGTAPRSGKTIAMTSYAFDSHHCRRIVKGSGASATVWNEGNFEDSSAGGTDQLAPIPFDAIVPRRSDAINLQVGFGHSATRVAFGVTRLEAPFMQIGMSAACAAELAIKNACAIQDVDYTALRAAILAGGVRADGGAVTNYATTPKLSQVN